jgi:heptosyltransferase-2
MQDKLTRILVVTKYRFIGDTLNAVPTFRAIKERWPDSEVTLLSGARACELLQNCPYVDRFIEFDPYRQTDKGIGRYLGLILRLRRQRYEIAFVLNRSFHSALTAALAGAKRRVGWSGFEFRDFMLTDFSIYDRDKLESECFLDVFRSVGGSYQNPPLLQTWLTSNELACAAKILPKGDFVLGVQPGATHGYKQWPLENFLEVCEKLVSGGSRTKIVLIGGPDEELIAERFIEKASPLLKEHVTNLVGRSSLRSSLSVVAQLDAFVGNDTAIRHAAVASDTLSIGLFGPTSASKWGNARPPRHIVLSSESGKMDDISVDAVLNAIAAWKNIINVPVSASLTCTERPLYRAAELCQDRSISDAPFVLERSRNE